MGPKQFNMLSKNTPVTGCEVIGFDDDFTKLRKGDPLHLYNFNSLKKDYEFTNYLNKTHILTVSNNFKLMMNFKFIVENF